MVLKPNHFKEALTGIVCWSLRLTLQGKDLLYLGGEKAKYPEQDVCLVVRTNLDRNRVWCFHHGLKEVGGPVWKQRSGVTDKDSALGFRHTYGGKSWNVYRE
jgi:hypothetical protein